MVVKCEPISEEAEIFNTLIANGDDPPLLQQREMRLLCLFKLKVAEETIMLLEEQQIDIDCLRKMRIEDVDTLFERKPLGLKIHFREAFLQWREEIGLPCQSIKSLSTRKRSAEFNEPLPEDPPKPQLLAQWEDCLQPQALLNDKESILPADKSVVSYRTFGWPMTPNTLRDVLNCSTLGRSILTMGCLGGLGKSLQYKLTAIIIDYHMEYEAKITAPQLENYAFCIATLLPHENPLTYHIPRGPNRHNPGGSLYSRFINQKISKKALAIGNSVAAS